MRRHPASDTGLRGLFVALSLVAVRLTAGAQQTALNSHEVNADRSLTLRYYAPAARHVTVSLDYDHKNPIPLVKGADGVWTVTTVPLAAELHSYSLTVDGVPILDPLNDDLERSPVFLDNDVRVPGVTPQPWDVADVPHGVVHHHVYRSSVLLNLPDGLEDYYVYTPPGYDASGSRSYPVLYLLHGWGALADSWIVEGAANLILDNQIAEGTSVPMIVVMPQGYGDMTFVTGGFGQWNDESKIGHNLGLFGDALLREILPQVEAGYRVSKRADDRAIAGLSMGGGESLVIGLNHTDTFGWVGGFSSAVVYGSFDGIVPARDKVSPRLLWISCGTGDDLIAGDRKFVAWLRAKGYQPDAIETPGIHNWPVWRDNLVHFVPLLFRPPPAGP